MRTLQFLTVLLTLASVQCLSVNMATKIMNWQKQCIDETGIDRALAMNAMLKHQYPDEMKFKEFILCITKKSGIIDEQGNLHTDKFKQILLSEGQNGAVADDIIKKCAVVKATSMDSAFDMFICHQSSAPKEVQI